jgi:CRP-like cAMP-binding protein
MSTFHFFERSTNFITVDAGKAIFHKGDPPDVMYGIVEGEVEIVLNGKVLNVLGPGEIFGEMALIDTNPRSADAIAKTECKLEPVNEARFTFMVQQTPYFAIQLMRVIVFRMRGLMEA